VTAGAGSVRLRPGRGFSRRDPLRGYGGRVNIGREADDGREEQVAVNPIPEGYHTVTPALSIDGAAEAIEFYKRAFGAEERYRMTTPDGKIAHAELQIGDSVVMVSDAFEWSGVKAPTQVGATTAGLFMYVEDVDAAFQSAVDAGATVAMPVETQFWGDRFGSLTDPFGHNWSLATHVEDVSREEIERRGREAFEQRPQLSGT
jgi:PhnB protein